MKSLGDVLYELRKSQKLTQSDLADSLNRKFNTKINKSMISKWENNKEVPRMEYIRNVASFFSVSLDYIIGLEENIEPDKLNNVTPIQNRLSQVIKIYGKVPAGVPIEAIEETIGEEEIPSEWFKGGQEYIALRVSGDSMYPKYIDGDIVIIKLQPDCESGQDAVVYVNGYDATLKTVIKQDDGMVRLQPANPEFQPKVFYPENIKILGVVKRLRRDF